MPDITDKKRLRQVATSDLSQSRLNDDFWYWCKTKGLNWLTVVLLIACGATVWNWWRTQREQKRDQSWADLNEAKLPQSYDVVAKAQSSGDPLALFAWLKAGELHLRDLQSGYLGGPPEQQPDGSLTTPERLTAESRKAAQDSADEYYSRVIESTKSQSDNPAMTPYTLSALFGKAAVAESRGELDKARGFLTDAKALADKPFPKLAEQAQSRLDSIDRLAVAIVLPSKASLPAKPETTPFSASEVSELLKSLDAQAPATAPTPPPLLQPTPGR